ncbi:hypothetical protein EYB25_005350 [Talaromyces marneffei]|nr:hypothetical protein EYB25_005350 [Talaromyces marneffei]
MKFLQFLLSLIILSLSARALASSCNNYHVTKALGDRRVFANVTCKVIEALLQFTNDIEKQSFQVLHKDVVAILQRIEDGIRRIALEFQLDSRDVYSLEAGFKAFEKDIEKVLKALKDKKTDIVGSGVCDVLVKDLKDLKDAGRQISILVLGKMPEEFFDIGKKASNKALQEIQDTINDFSKEPSCRSIKVTFTF